MEKKLELVDKKNNKSYSEEYFDLIMGLLGAKGKVLSFILKNVNRQNQLCYSIEQVAKETNVAKQTAFNVFKILREKNLIKKSGLVWIVSSNLVKYIKG